MALASPQPRTPVDQEAEFDDHRSAPPSAGPGSDAGQEFGGLEMSHASAAKIPAPERMLSRAMSATSHGENSASSHERGLLVYSLSFRVSSKQENR